MVVSRGGSHIESVQFCFNVHLSFFSYSVWKEQDADLDVEKVSWQALC